MYSESADTEADARATMLMYVVEHKLTTVETTKTRRKGLHRGREQAGIKNGAFIVP